MNFTSKQLNQYETVSEILTAARKEKGLELSKIEKIIKISKKYLEALEAGRYEKLPSAIYTKNFAKNYAAYLGLDVNKISELIERELGIINQLNNPKTVGPEPQILKNKILITPKILRHAIITLLVLGCITYLGFEINAIFSPPPLTVTSPMPELVTNQNAIVVEGDTLPGIQLTINNQEILADKSGHFSKNLDLQTGVNIIEVQAKKKHSQAFVVIRRVMLEAPPLVIDNANPSSPLVTPEVNAPKTPTNPAENAP